VRAACRAAAAGLQEQIPAVRARKVHVPEAWLALVIEREGERLWVQRPAEGLLAGLWTPVLVGLPPSRDAPTGDTVGELVRTRLGAELAGPLASAGAVKHVFSHRTWQLSPWRVPVHRLDERAVLGELGERAVWCPRDAAPPGGQPQLATKLLRALASAAAPSGDGEGALAAAPPPRAQKYQREAIAKSPRVGSKNGAT
jgi:adenine-specific DNA glycosylase